MNQSREPSRWLLDAKADPLARLLLRSSHNDGPSPKRLLAAPATIAALVAAQSVTTSAAAASATVAMTIGATSTAGVAISAGATPSVSIGTATAGAVAAITTKSSVATLPILLKSVIVGMAVGGIVVATVQKSREAERESRPAIAALAQQRASSSVPNPVVEAARRTSNTGVAATVPVPLGTLQPTPAPSDVRPVRIISGSPVHIAVALPSETPITQAMQASTDIAREVGLLDSARRPLEIGSASRAIQQLDQYAELQRRNLEPEATVLRVRALLVLRRKTEAEQEARAFYLGAPHAPQGQIIRELIEQSRLGDPDAGD